MSNSTDDTAALVLFPLAGTRTRPDKVTAQLAEMDKLRRAAVLRRAADTDPARRLERETLVAVVRGFLRAGREADAEAVLGMLLDRVDRALNSVISRWTGVTAEDRIDARQQIVEIICEKVCDLRPGSEFWECNWTWCVNKKLISLWRSFAVNALPMTGSIAATPGGEESDRVAQAADPTDGFLEMELADWVKIVSGGHPQKSRALLLKISEFSDEEIAKDIGVTTRTLRNWNAEFVSAYKRMKAEEQKAAGERREEDARGINSSR